MNTKSRQARLLFGLLSILLAAGCAYNKHEIPASCGKDYVYSDVEPFFRDYSCLSCHKAGGSLPLLGDQASIKSYIGSNRIAFENSIDSIGSHPMPKGDLRMPDSCRTRIKIWICGGMK